MKIETVTAWIMTLNAIGSFAMFFLGYASWREPMFLLGGAWFAWRCVDVG